MFYPFGNVSTTFKFPEQRKLQTEGCATIEDLANPAEVDDEGQPCRFLVEKNGNTTYPAVGHYADLVSFARNEVGIESIELGIYNSDVKTAEVFSKGDSGALVWHTKDGKAHIVGSTPHWRKQRRFNMSRTAPD